MKMMGTVCIFWGALYAYLQFRRRTVFALHLMRSMASDLAVLKNGVCIYRKTLPAICDVELRNSLSAPYFWIPLRKLLEENMLPVRQCWERAACDLPDSIALRVGMLGPLLVSGGDSFAKAIDEVRVDLLNDIRAEELKMSASMRLAGAICLSSACFLILILL